MLLSAPTAYPHTTLSTCVSYPPAPEPCTPSPPLAQAASAARPAPPAARGGRSGPGGGTKGVRYRCIRYWCWVPCVTPAPAGVAPAYLDGLLMSQPATIIPHQPCALIPRSPAVASPVRPRPHTSTHTFGRLRMCSCARCPPQPRCSLQPAPPPHLRRVAYLDRLLMSHASLVSPVSEPCEPREPRELRAPAPM